MQKTNDNSYKKWRSMVKNMLCVLFVSMLLSCGNHQGDNTAGNKDTVSATESIHEPAGADIVKLSMEQMQAINLQLGKVEQKELTATIKANGTLRVPNEYRGKATPLFSGVIKTLHIQLGSQVAKGQLIATVSNPEFIQLQEEYIALGSKITLAEQELDRQQALHGGQAGILKNLQQAKATLSALQTRKSALGQQLMMMGINPKGLNNDNMRSTLTVISPVAGTVSQVYAEIGSYVNPNSPVAEVVNNHALHLDLQIFEKDLPLIKIGQIIHFTLTNNPTAEYDAEVYSIGAAFEKDSKTIPVHCRVNSDKSAMIDQMNITGIVSLNKTATPAVPRDAIINEGGKDYLFVTLDDTDDPASTRSFKKTQVFTGVSQMGYTAVNFIEPIDKKASIVTKGAYFLNAKLTNVEEE